MAETAADLIRTTFAKPPTHTRPCQWCPRVVGPYYNPGDARGALMLHINWVHNVETHSRRTEDAVDYTLERPAISMLAGTSPRGYRVR